MNGSHLNMPWLTWPVRTVFLTERKEKQCCSLTSPETCVVFSTWGQGTDACLLCCSWTVPRHLEWPWIFHLPCCNGHESASKITRRSPSLHTTSTTRYPTLVASMLLSLVSLFTIVLMSASILSMPRF